MWKKFVFLILIVSILGFLFIGGTTAPAQAQEATTTENNSSVCVVLFYSPSCPHCAEVENHLNTVSDQVHVKKYIASRNPQLSKKYLKAYDVPQEYWGGVPLTYIGDDYAVGSTNSIELIDQKIQKNEKLPCKSTEWLNQKSGGVADITLPSIISLALADAINPCALAVLFILLTTIMSLQPNNRKGLILSGISFAVAVFIVYFILGFLLIKGIQYFITSSTINLSILYKSVGVLAILLGLLNIKDAFSHGAGGFVMEVPFSWRPKMQHHLTAPLWEHSILLGSFIAGIFVSLFLLPCTSGPYFVAGGLLSGLPLSRSIPLLALYNVIFVLPMILLTILVAFGVLSTEKASEWREENIEKLHLAIGTLLITIGGLILFGFT